MTRGQAALSSGRGFAVGVVLAGLPAILAIPAAAQPSGAPGTNAFLQQQRVIDDKLADDRRSVAPLQSVLDWQWGGWIDYYYFNFDDGVQDSRRVHRPGLTLWSRLSIDQGAHEFFARMRLRYNYFESGDEFLRPEDWVGPNFDRAWYKLDVMRAFRLNEPSDPIQLQTRIGRQSVLLGTGYVLDLPVDAVTLQADIDKLRVQALFAKTIGSVPNIDRSDPVDSHSHRHLYGLQMEYTGLQRHVPFVYALWNDDKTDERPKDPLQNYSYDTFYVGLGSRGEILHNWNYWGEAVFESGRSFGDGMFLRRDYVEAWALDVGTEYLFDKPSRPRLGFEYMFASGDGDRRFSPTNARGGNRNGRRDTSFNAFGFRDTGLALGPTLSNIHIWKFSGSCQPFHKVEALRDFELGTSWYLYQRNAAGGAISDFTANQRGNGWLGWEMDYYLNWRIASDLSWTFRWGQFFPGSAYSDQDDRHFVFTGLTWSF